MSDRYDGMPTPDEVKAHLDKLINRGRKAPVHKEQWRKQDARWLAEHGDEICPCCGKKLRDVVW